MPTEIEEDMPVQPTEPADLVQPPKEEPFAAPVEETIELPPEPPPSSFPTVAGDRLLTMEEMLALMPSAEISRRSEVVTDSIGQAPVLTEETLAEMAAGRRATNIVPNAAADAAAQLAAKTSAEQAAGRAVIERRNREIDRSRLIQAHANAQKLQQNSEPDNDDLSYNAPR